MRTKVLTTIALLCALLTVGCATLTPEEKAAREAEAKEYVKSAMVHQKYKINITSMNPMRGNSRSISGPWLKVDSTTVECMLPYIGLDDVPHMKTRGEVRMGSKLEFKSDVKDYVLAIEPNEERAVVRFKADDHGFECKFLITVDNLGGARIHVEPEGRDFIDYEGRVAIQK